MGPIRILLVDDHVLFRKGMARLIDSQPDFEVIAEAEDGYQAVQYARRFKPDIILMDIHMPECDGQEATRLIINEWPEAQIVMLTVSDDDQDLFTAIRNGALGYLVKKIEPEELFARLRGVSQGEAPLSRVMANRILREFARLGTGTPPPDSTRSLTPRERQVLRLVSKGLTNKEIGAQLHIAENTVKNHLRNILEKLHLQNRAQAAAYAVREGLVDNERSKPK
jgi:two-component system, NarL family, nitrate/nitrite response regulator NarL